MSKSYDVILAPIDGSNQSKLALENAVNIALSCDAKLIIAMVVNDDYAFMNNTYRSSLKKGMAIRAQEILDEFKPIAVQAGLNNVETVVEYGVAKNVIANKLVNDYSVDLIIMGASGFNAVSRMVLGSNTEYVVRNAACDVFIVKDP